MFLTNLTHLVNNMARQAAAPRTTGRAEGWLPRQGWSSDTRPGDDLEERITDSLEQEEPISWIAPAILLGTTFAAIVLFALSH